MVARLTSLAVRRPRTTIVAWALVFVVGMVAVGGLFSSLDADLDGPPVVESEQVNERLDAFDPDGGEYSFSSGTYIGSGLPHFVTAKGEMRSLEPVVAHELSHACLAHLPLPLWLNEGLAVNTERRLCGGANRFTPLEMHRKHAAFWDDGKIQEFWSGTSFRRADDGNMLSYDLGRILVEQLSRGDWRRFAGFVNAAHHEDAGAAAAACELDVDLGASVAAWVGRSGANWAPDPKRWQQMETRTE